MSQTEKGKKGRKVSLQLLIFLALFFVGILPAGIIGGVMINNSFQDHIKNKTSELAYQSLALIDEMREKNYLQDMSQEGISAELDQFARTYRGRIILVNEDFRICKDTYHLSEGKYNISEAVVRAFSGQSSSRHDKKGGYIELQLPITNSEGMVAGVFVLTSSTEFQETLREQLTEFFQVLMVTIMILLTAVSLLLSFLLVRPMQKIGKAIDNSSKESMGGDIQVNDCLESQRIAQAYNRMLGRLRILDESRQQFVSNVSHELKTPITSIRVLADSLIGQEEVPVEMYREFMLDISGEIERESKVIDDLLTLVRMDKSNPELNIAPTNINEMLESLLMRLRPLALQKNVDLTLESFRPVVADVDEVKLNLAVMNLVENAIKYNVDNGWVHVTLNADHQYVYLKVADSGIGIPEKDWDHIFERFYRVDKARSRANGGTGLGLAITKSIISLHHGEIRVHSVDEEGTTFMVRIPLTYVRQEGKS